MTQVHSEQPAADAEAAARAAYRWSCALASPHRRVVGPNLVPCRLDRKAIIKWARDAVPGNEQGPGRLAQLLRRSTARDPEWRAWTWAIIPATDGLVVVDVDDMRHLPRALDVFGRTDVAMRSRSGKVHLYYAGPPVDSTTGLWGPGSIDVKSTAMIHVAGDGARPINELPDRLPRGYLRPLLPAFRRDAYEEILRRQREQRETADYDDGAPPRYATTRDEVEQVRRYMRAAGPAVAGAGGHYHTLYLLRRIGDLGASERLALELALEWDERNSPPWGADVIRAKVRDAYHTRHRPIGYEMSGLEAWDDDPSDLMGPDEIRQRLREAAGS
jgi:hypothetical protein